MKLSQSCQALVQGFPVYVTILCSSQLDSEKLEALCIVLYPLLSYMHWGAAEKYVFPEWNLSHRELSLGGDFFFLQSHTYRYVGGGGNKNENKQICFYPSYFPLISRIQMGASVGV